jgi:serine/threonine-protein kinase
LVTGRVPFEADSEYSLMRKHLQEAPVPPVQWMPDVPQGLNEIILTAMEKDRNRRFQSAAAMGAALRSLAASLGVTTAAPAMSTPTPSSGWNAAAPAPSPEQAWGAPPAPQPRKHSNRALYIVIGSVATIAVLVVAAMQLPRFFGTRAGAPAAVESQAPPPEAQPAQQAPETPPTAEQPAQPEPAAAAQQTSPQPGSISTSSGSPAPAGAAASSARRVESQPAAQRRPQAAEPAAYQSPGAPPANEPPAQAQQASPAPTAPAPSAVDERELSELRERLMLLAARVNAAQASLNRLKQEQAHMGLGLRGDIAASAQRVEFYMDEAEAAIKRGDAAAAKRHLENADRETARLEKFLGR